MTRITCAAIGLVTLVAASCASTAEVSTTSDPNRSPASSEVATPEPPSVATPNSANESTPSVRAGAGAWVLPEPPAGYVAARATEDDEARTVTYEQTGPQGDQFVISAGVTTRDIGADYRSDERAKPVTVQGRPGYITELHSEGQHYGTSVAWEADDGRWVGLAWTEIAPQQAVLDLAETMVFIGDDQWAQLYDGLRVVFWDGQAYDDPIAHELAVGHAGDVPYRLLALVPSDYPRGSADYRPACYRLEVDGTQSHDSCAGAEWTQIGEWAVVYGRAGFGPSEVIVQRTDREGAVLPEQPVVEPVIAFDDPMSVFFLAVVPTEWCWVVVIGERGGARPQSENAAPAPPDDRTPVFCDGQS